MMEVSIPLLFLEISQLRVQFRKLAETMSFVRMVKSNTCFLKTFAYHKPVFLPIVKYYPNSSFLYDEVLIVRSIERVK